MRLEKSLSIAAAALMATGLAASALAASATYTCTGATDQIGINALILATSPGDVITLDGACVTSAFVVINHPGITLQGPASITRSPAGSVIAIQSHSAALNGSGSTIQNLDLIVTAGGNAVTNSSPVVGALDQPDNITIRNCHLKAVGARCIQQFAHNGPPFNDIDRATGLPGGICDGWVIANNTCETNEVAMLLTGNHLTVVNNEVLSRPTTAAGGGRGITLQNNFGVPTAFGALAGASGSTVYHNVVTLERTVAGASIRALSDLGYFGSAPEPPNARSFGNTWEKNCVDMTTVASAAMVATQAYGIQTQFVERSLYTKNNVRMNLQPGVYPNNFGLGSFDQWDSEFSQNDIAGGGDYASFTALPTAKNNLIEANNFDLGSPEIPPPQFVLEDEGAVPGQGDTFRLNKFCTGAIVTFSPETIDGGNNMSGHFCSHDPSELPQAHDCGQGLGYAGAKSMGEPVDISAGTQPGLTATLDVAVGPLFTDDVGAGTVVIPESHKGRGPGGLTQRRVR
jgi:hypothetical protein